MPNNLRSNPNSGSRPRIADRIVQKVHERLPQAEAIPEHNDVVKIGADMDRDTRIDASGCTEVHAFTDHLPQQHLIAGSSAIGTPNLTAHAKTPEDVPHVLTSGDYASCALACWRRNVIVLAHEVSQPDDRGQRMAKFMVQFA
jgi:hypothetical protein